MKFHSVLSLPEKWFWSPHKNIDCWPLENSSDAHDPGSCHLRRLQHCERCNTSKSVWWALPSRPL